MVSSVGSLNYASPIFSVNASAPAQTASGLAEQTNFECDKFVKNEELKNVSALSKKEKQEIIKKANATSTGWAVFFPMLSTAYFALRSDKTIADKYNLDVNKDKNFINEIRETQTLWTLPSLLVGVSILPYFYNKCRNVNNIKIDS